MARVNVYKQNQLASSLVGTAGVDQSGAIVADAALRNANVNAESALYSQRQDQARAAEFGRTIAGFAQDVGQGIVADVVAARNAQKQMDSLKNGMAADFFLNQLSSSHALRMKELKTKYGNDTTGMDEEYTQVVNSDFNTMVRANKLDKRPEVLAKLSNGWSTITREGFKSVTNYQYDKEIDLAKSRVEVANRDFEINMGNATSPEEADNLVNAHNTMLSTANLAFGADGVLKMEDSHRKGVMNFLQSQAKAGYQVDAEQLYRDYNKPSQVEQWVNAGAYKDTLDVKDKDSILALDKAYKKAAIEKQKNLIEWENTGTGVKVSNMVALTVRDIAKTKNPGLAVDTLLALDNMRQAEMAKPEWARDKAVVNDLESSMKYMAYLGNITQRNVTSEADRQVGIQRQVEGDRRADESYAYTMNERAIKAAQTSPEGRAAQFNLPRQVNNVLTAINNGNGDSIRGTTIRELNTQLNDAWAHRYITHDDYQKYTGQLAKAAEAIAPDELKQGARAGGWKEFVANGFVGIGTWDYETERDKGASDAMLNALGVRVGSPENVDLNKQIAERMDVLVKNTKEFQNNPPKGAQVLKLKMMAEKRIFDSWLAGRESTFQFKAPEPPAPRPVRSTIPAPPASPATGAVNGLVPDAPPGLNLTAPPPAEGIIPPNSRGVK